MQIGPLDVLGDGEGGGCAGSPGGSELGLAAPDRDRLAGESVLQLGRIELADDVTFLQRALASGRLRVTTNRPSTELKTSVPAASRSGFLPVLCDGDRTPNRVRGAYQGSDAKLE